LEGLTIGWRQPTNIQREIILLQYKQTLKLSMGNITQSAFALFLLFAAGTTAVAQDYTYSTFTAPFQYLVNPDTLSSDIPDWDDDVFFISPGFQVNVMGELYDSIAVESNGSLLLYNTPEQLLGGVDTLPVLMPFGEFLSNAGYTDLRYRTDGNSPISYEITGTAGSRIAKFEWRNAGFFSDPNNYMDSVNFQAWVYEGSGDVEFRYGSSQVSPDSYDGISGPTVGIGPIDPVSYDFLAGYFLTGDSTSATLVNAYASLTGTPTNGTVFRFANDLTAHVKEIGKLAVAVFPNPATEAVTIRFETEGNTDVAITDLTGHTVIAEQVTANGTVSLQMDVSALAPGVYLVAINGMATGAKVIVK
jgi:hypothetical protein